MSRREVRDIAFEAGILHCAITIEHNTNFLEGNRFGFRVGEVDHDNLEDDDGTDDDIVPASGQYTSQRSIRNVEHILPGNVLKRHRVQIIESCDGSLHQEILRTDELGANVVAHDLHSIPEILSKRRYRLSTMSTLVNAGETYPVRIPFQTVL